jgi:hypothetical protein
MGFVVLWFLSARRIKRLKAQLVKAKSGRDQLQAEAQAQSNKRIERLAFDAKIRQNLEKEIGSLKTQLAYASQSKQNAWQDSNRIQTERDEAINEARILRAGNDELRQQLAQAKEEIEGWRLASESQQETAKQLEAAWEEALTDLTEADQKLAAIRELVNPKPQEAQEAA